MTLVSDASIFDSIPVKREVKAVVSGIYIMEVKGVRGPLETPKKKKGFWARMKDKVTGAEKKEAEAAAKAAKSGKKKSR